MCMSDKPPPTPPRSLYESSANGSESSSVSDCDSSNATVPGIATTEKLPAHFDSGIFPASALATLAWCTAGLLLGLGLVAFSLEFPFLLSPEAASKTYHLAYYSYDDELSHFDNTVWTYGTDYALAVIMSYMIWSVMKTYRAGLTGSICCKSSLLLLSYALSVSSGAVAHHFYTTLESRNTASFRFLWTVCVGTVTGASYFMGLSCSQVLKQFQKEPNCNEILQRLPIVPDSFWGVFGASATAVCIYGGMSFQRPACDIFIAGITQTPSSFYMTVFFFLVEHKHVQRWAKVAGSICFILNAPLLPMYPLLVQYTDWSLASINTLLHCWLCVAWTLQGVVLRHASKALVSAHSATKKEL